MRPEQIDDPVDCVVVRIIDPVKPGEYSDIAADPIVTGAAENLIAASAAVNQIYLGISKNPVVTIATRKQIPSIDARRDRGIIQVCFQGIDAPCVEDIVPSPACEQIPARAPFENIVPAAAEAGIVAASEFDAVVPAQVVLNEIVAAAHDEVRVSRRPGKLFVQIIAIRRRCRRIYGVAKLIRAQIYEIAQEFRLRGGNCGGLALESVGEMNPQIAVMEPLDAKRPVYDEGAANGRISIEFVTELSIAAKVSPALLASAASKQSGACENHSIAVYNRVRVQQCRKTVCVVAGPALEAVRPFSADQRVVARAADQSVVAGAALQIVVAVAAVEMVSACPAKQAIATRQPGNTLAVVRGFRTENHSAVVRNAT